MLKWISRDGKLIILSLGLRTLAQSAASLILALYLDKLGYSLVQIGAFLSAGVAGSAVLTFTVSLISERIGRRRLMVFFAALMGLAGLAMVFVDNFFLLLLIAFFGNVGAGGISPAAPLEQASLSDAAPPEKRTELFAIYRIAGLAGGTVGALSAGLPSLLQSNFSMSEMGSLKTMYVGFSILLLAAAFIYALLSPSIETAHSGQGWSNPLKLPSRRLIFTLSGLFAVDAFAGSLFMQSLAAYWFYTKFGMNLKDLALVFSLSNVLAAISLWVAAKLGNLIGLINTMVFTHIPASLLLIAAAFTPNAGLVIVFWQLRAFFSMMDVPTRDSYTMSVVQPHERVAMAGINTVGRSVTGIVAPLASTALWQAISATVPIIGCAVLKIAYDLSLYAMFHNVKEPHEVKKQ
ncbi:MAG TPA: MFS transporter [Dehalococcoidales bacterium]|nr:MFS transporter [Dehalococcoidales bacterium]